MSFDVWNEQLRRGALELAVLLALSPGPRYGLEIIRHLESFSDLVITEGTIYPLLARLTRDGMLQAHWSATEAAHPRKYYRLTASGRRRLNDMCDHWRDFAEKLDRLIKAAGASR
jgi:PadR family transcriptional regulator PadR